MTRTAGWHPEDIRAALRKRHGTVLAFTRTTNYTLSAVCKVINGMFFPGPAAAIASDLGLPPWTLWPEWFLPDGTPRQGRGAPNTKKSSAARRRRNVQSRSAA